MQQMPPDWRLVTGFGIRTFRNRIFHICVRTIAREQSWNGLECATILLKISTTLRFQKVIRSEGMYFTGSLRGQMLACADFRSGPDPDIR